MLVTVDLLGVTAAMRQRIGATLSRTHHLEAEAWMLAASHTHCGPVVDDQLSVAYDLDDAQRSAIAAYTATLESTIAGLAGAALERLEPVGLACGEGRATFGANRRAQFLPPGPVDPAVPVLRVTRADRRPLAIVFGYACHNTTLQAAMTQFHGDYAGVAQRELERRYPAAQAMFLAGCGADVNPSPRGTTDAGRATRGGAGRRGRRSAGAPARRLRATPPRASSWSTCRLATSPTGPDGSPGSSPTTSTSGATRR